MRGLGSRRITGLVATVVLAAAMVAPWVAAPSAHADSRSDAMAFVGPINALRAARGLAPLTVDTRLTGLATWWSGKMAAAAFLSHNGSLASMLPAGWTLGGENVGTGPSSGSLESAFENSPEHFANMMRPEFTAIGVGVVWSGSTMWVTEDFTAGVAPMVDKVVGIAAMRGTNNAAGYWVATSTGGVSGFGAAVNYGSMAGQPLSAPMISLAATADGRGY